MFDRTRANIKITMDGADFEDLGLSNLVLDVSIKETDVGMSQLSLSLRNDNFALTGRFLQSRRAILRVSVAWQSAFDTKSTTPFMLLGTFILDEPNFSFPDEGYPTITLRGLSEEIVLSETQHQIAFENLSDADIVRDIAVNFGSQDNRQRRNQPFGTTYIQETPAFPGAVPPEVTEIDETDEDSSIISEIVARLKAFLQGSGQSTQIESDYVFLQKLAERNGFQLFVIPSEEGRGELFFGKLTQEVIEALGLEPNRTLTYRPSGSGERSEFTGKFRIRTFQRGLKVEARIIDPFTKEQSGKGGIEGFAAVMALRNNSVQEGESQAVEDSARRYIEQTADDNGEPFTTSLDITNRIRIEEGKNSEPPTIILRQYGSSDNTASLQRHAAAIEEQGLWSIEGSIKPVAGIVGLRARSFLEINGTGPFSGKYYVKTANHKWKPNKFTQTFELRSFRIGIAPNVSREETVELPVVAVARLDGSVEEFGE